MRITVTSLRCSIRQEILTHPNLYRLYRTPRILGLILYNPSFHTNPSYTGLLSDTLRLVTVSCVLPHGTHRPVPRPVRNSQLVLESSWKLVSSLFYFRKPPSDYLVDTDPGKYPTILSLGPISPFQPSTTFRTKTTGTTLTHLPFSVYTICL